MKVKNFAGFMKSRVNESDDSAMDMGYEGDGFDGDANQYNIENYGMGYGANPEEEEEESTDADTDTPEGEETEPVTLDSLKAMIEDLTERVEKLEGGGEEGEEEPKEGEETPEETPEEAPAK